MVNVIYTEKFEREFKKIDLAIKEKAKKQLTKIIKNPTVGKPLKYNLKGEKTIYVRPFRIIYSFSKGTIYFLRLQHRKDIYD